VSGWPTARLEDCAEIVSGATPSTSEPAYWDGDICWATPKDLSELDGAYISNSPRKITRNGLQSCAATVLPPGSVLFSSRAPIGHVAINTVPMATNQGFKSFVPNCERVHAKFLYHWLRSNRPYLESLGNGATFKEVSKAVVARVEIPLPPLPEQRRIAAILDKADALRARRRAALAKLDTLTQSIFLDMFGDPATNPKAWPVQIVAEYVREFQGGKSIEADADEGAPVRNRVLKVSAVTSAVFMPSESKPVPDSYVPPQEHFVRSGDLLFSRANTTELVGAVAYVYDTPTNVLLPDKLWRFVWRDRENVEPLFIWALFRTQAVRYEIRRRATGTSGSMKNISQEKLLGISTIYPPIAIQRGFVQHCRGIGVLQKRHQSSIAGGEELFASLQHRAFRGEL
jgi:type I restriction enzyme S subunit